MLVKDLIEQLKHFDGEHNVAVVTELIGDIQEVE